MSQLLGLLEQAVADAMTANTGCVVSGGVDSSTITSLARRLRPGITTLTGWYDQPGFDERRYARLVTDPKHHVEVEITADDFVEWFDSMALAARPPFMGMGAFGQFMVAKAASEAGLGRVLSGEGGDELFGGYARLIRVAGGLLPQGYENYEPPADYPRNLEDALAYDWERLPDLLAVDDQMCGWWGLEAVAPMLDPLVVEWALALPARDRVGKRTLRRAVAGLVPDAILGRRDKMGMPIPLVRWANEHDGVRQLVQDRIGYLPDPGRPWDRAWWVELLAATKGMVRAA